VNEIIDPALLAAMVCIQLQLITQILLSSSCTFGHTH